MVAFHILLCVLHGWTIMPQPLTGPTGKQDMKLHIFLRPDLPKASAGAWIFSMEVNTLSLTLPSLAFLVTYNTDLLTLGLD